MRRFLLATFVCLAALPSAVGQQSRPVPQDPARQEQFRKETLEWNRRTLVEAYEQVGRKNPRWDEPARECLEAAARYFSNVVEPPTSYLDVHNGAKQAIEGGCDDPMILYLFAHTSFGPYAPGREELLRRYAAAASALERSAYPCIRRFTALYKAVQAMVDSGGDAAEAERLLMASLRVLAESAARDTPSWDLEDAWCMTVRAVQLALSKLKKNSFAAFQQIDAQLAKTPAFEAFRLMAKADFYIRYAWEARGAGYADTVSPEAFEKFEARLRIARKALGEAWLAKPGDCHTANLMLTVALGLNYSREEMEKWFARAMTANGDNKGACRAKLEWLDPKWHGTEEEMVAFGRACRDTKNVRGGITILLADAHYRAMTKRTTKAGQEEYMRRDDVWRDIYPVFSEYLQLYPSDFTERTRFAVFAYWAGHYDISQRQFLLLGDNIRANWGYPEKDIKVIRDFVAKESNRTPNAGPKATTTTGQKPAPARIEPPAPKAAPSENRTAVFAVEKFRYTLPGPDWSWGEKPTPESLFVATNKRGLSVMGSAIKQPRFVPYDEQSVASLERGLLDEMGREVKKRGGRLTTFQGLPCYQFETTYAGKRTSVMRFFQANGYLCGIMVTGGKNPVENDPEFEKIMNGFAFTEPPVRTWGDDPPKKNDSVAYRIGEMLGYFTIGAIVIAFVVKLARKKSPPNSEDFTARRPGYSLSQPSQNALSLTARWQAEDSAMVAAMADYRSGMKSLGRGLIALAILHFLGVGLVLLVPTHALIAVILVVVILGGMATIHLVLGVLALNMFNWVNYVVAAWSSLLIALNFIGLGVQQNKPGGPIGSCIGFLIAGSLLYFSIKNVGLLENAKKAGARVQSQPE